MGYKLNCGIELTECDPGDSFIFDGHPHKLHYMGGRTYFEIGFKRQYMICQDGKEWDISKLTPTEETKRKVVERSKIPAEAYVFYRMDPDEVMRKLYKFAGFDSVEPLESPVNVSPAPNLKDKLIALKIGIVGNYGAASVVQEAIDAVSAEPLARIIDWRGGEEAQLGDIAILKKDKDANYKCTLECDMSKSFFKVLYGGVLDKSDVEAVIRINTAAIPKQRTMTKTEVEREFGVKISD